MNTIVLEIIVFYYFCLNLRYSFAESSTKYFLCALVISLHHHQQEDTCPPTHILSSHSSLLMLCVCVPQGPPSVSSAVHEAAVHPLVLGPCWGHRCNSSGGSGQAPQKPALQANRYQHARLHSAGKLANFPLQDDSCARK